MFELKLESKQYNACLAITCTTQGTNTDSIFSKLGLELLPARSWYKKSFLSTK